jgi:hypothetical protein
MDRAVEGERTTGAPSVAPRVAGRADPAAAASLALANLRGVAVLFLVAFHAAIAYLVFARAGPQRFEAPPWDWRAFPIVDPARWIGFDLFCAWQDVYLMALMFFLSGLFAWQGLARKGRRRFLHERIRRLAPPFAFGVLVVTPLAIYPAFLLRADDPGPLAYARHLLALPFWPNGPMWFLWLLLAFAAAAAALHRVAPEWGLRLGRLSGERPGVYLLVLAAAAAAAYVPLALAFTPWRWADRGPLALQLSRPLLYAVWYFAGIGVGAQGLGRGLLATDGPLALRWRIWFAAALASLCAWMGLAAMTLGSATPAPLLLQLVADLAYALAGVAGVFFLLAAGLRFGAARSPRLEALSIDAFGIYLLHDAPVVWLQFGLLGLPWPAAVKAPVVFAGALGAAWAATQAMRRLGLGARLLGDRAGAARLPAAARRRTEPGVMAQPKP